MRWIYWLIVLVLAGLTAWDMIRQRGFWRILGTGIVLLLFVLRLLFIQ